MRVRVLPGDAVEKADALALGFETGHGLRRIRYALVDFPGNKRFFRRLFTTAPGFGLASSYPKLLHTFSAMDMDMDTQATYRASRYVARSRVE
jgi:hypothetical protein